jgi:hypothetical protein
MCPVYAAVVGSAGTNMNLRLTVHMNRERSC